MARMKKGLVGRGVRMPKEGGPMGATKGSSLKLKTDMHPAAQAPKRHSKAAHKHSNMKGY